VKFSNSQISGSGFLYYLIVFLFIIIGFCVFITFFIGKGVDIYFNDNSDISLWVESVIVLLLLLFIIFIIIIIIIYIYNTIHIDRKRVVTVGTVLYQVRIVS
jgi:hypothetical protein